MDPRNPNLQQSREVFPTSTPTSSERPTRVESGRFFSLTRGHDDLPESASQQSLQLVSCPPGETLKLKFKTRLFQQFPHKLTLPRPQNPIVPRKSGLATGPEPKIPSKTLKILFPHTAREPSDTHDARNYFDSSPRKHSRAAEHGGKKIAHEGKNEKENFPFLLLSSCVN